VPVLSIPQAHPTQGKRTFVEDCVEFIVEFSSHGPPKGGIDACLSGIQLRLGACLATVKVLSPTLVVVKYYANQTHHDFTTDLGSQSETSRDGVDWLLCHSG
jgi:hypothetical protein